jgi:predicted transcriptional regulator
LTPISTFCYILYMLKTVKIEQAEYKAIKALSKKEGRHLQYVLTEAIRQYLAAQSKEAAA